VIIEYTKTREDAHSPQRANPSDAGLDVFYSTKEPGEIIAVHPNQAAKLNLVVGACVIDSGYDGEVFINVHNIGRDTRVIQDGDKIAQLVMMPVVHFQPQENTEGTLYDYPKTISNRGTGALGSTDE